MGPVQRLPAVACALVSDVAHVAGIKTLRSAKLIVNVFRTAKPSLDRILSLRPGLIEFSPAKLLPWTAHRTSPSPYRQTTRRRDL